MARLINITGKALTGEWGDDDTAGNGVPVLRTTNFTNTGEVSFCNVVRRIIRKKNIDDKFLRSGDIVIEKSGGSDKQPVGRVVYFEGAEGTYLFNNFTGLLRISNKQKWYPKYVFYALFANYIRGGTRTYENKTTGLHNLQLDRFLNSFEISDLDLSVQIRRSHQLDEASRMIHIRQQQLSRLDELVKARFVEMFGDWRRNPKALPQVLGRELFVFSSGKFLPATKRKECGIPVYGGHGVTWYTNTALVHKPTIIIGRVGAQCGNINLAIEPVWITDNAIYIKCCKREMNNLFLKELMTQMDFHQYADYSGQPKITQRPLEEARYIVPNMELQNAFAAFVGQVDKSKVVVEMRGKNLTWRERCAKRVNEAFSIPNLSFSRDYGLGICTGKTQAD